MNPTGRVDLFFTSMLIVALLVGDSVFDWFARHGVPVIYRSVLGPLDVGGTIEFAYVAALMLVGFAARRWWVFFGAFGAFLIGLLFLAAKLVAA